jgi:mannose-1-phosphate guanylyltransferase
VTAGKYLRKSGYYWNSGMFIWKADAVLQAMKEHMPKLSAGLGRVEKAFNTEKAQSITKSVFSKIKPESIDYGILEKVT